MDNFYYQKYLPSRNGRMGYDEQNDNMWRNMNYIGRRNENIENHQNEYLKLRNININNNNDNNEESKKPSIYKIMKNFEKNGITSNIIDKNDDNIPKCEKEIKRQKKINKKYISDHCVFCKNNNENEGMVRSHAVRNQYGHVICPKLRKYVCPLCQATGDNAHTIKYCPKKPIITMEQCQQIETYFNKLYV